MKRFTKLLTSAFIALTLSACATAPKKPSDPLKPRGWTTLQVVNIQKAPDRCEKPSSTGATIVGGVIGGLLGNQIGGGNGKKVATGVGVLVGANAGSKTNKNKALKCKKRGYLYTLAYLDKGENLRYMTKRFDKKKHRLNEYIELKF